MRLANVTEEARPAAVDDGRVLFLDELPGIGSIEELIAGGAEALAAVESAVANPAAHWIPDPGTRTAPLRGTGKIICVGLNYADHVREANLEMPKVPLLFAKTANTITAPEASVTWDPEVTREVDWEAELAVIVGAPLRDAKVATVLDAVFGYTVANDLSARDLQFSDGQWFRGKSLDDFCPLGPEIVLAAAFGDPQDKSIRSRVNGDVMQDSSTAEMVFGVAEILSFISRSITLDPGDLVLTGTPWGVGAFREPPVFLSPGDVVEVEVEGIGILRSPIV